MHLSKANLRIGNVLAKLIVVAALMFSFTIHTPQPVSAGTVVTYPTPSYFAASTAYSLTVDSTAVNVVRHFDYSFAQLSYSGTATFKVTARDPITSYNISPHSYGINATVSGRDLTFSLPQAGSRYLVITVNNLENLVIMADPIETGAPVPNGGSVKSIMDYPGVDNTGGNLMTPIIQQAINEANARSGGGTVYFPAGIYKFSQIELKSNVTIYLAAGAVLRGSSTLSDYDFSRAHFRPTNIRIVGASNVAIKGRGMIDSNGTTLTTGQDGPNRGNIIHSWKDSSGTMPTGLTFEGITLRDGTTWNMSIEDATHVNISNVKVINNINWHHNDAFDLLNVSHAVVDQCFAYTGDDVFNAKSMTEEPITDVVYQNSVAYTRSAGTKVGMQGYAAVSDLWFINIDVIMGYRGISVSHDKGDGVWDGIYFIDIRTERIHNNGTSGQFRTAPILVWTAQYGGTQAGSVSNVHIIGASFEDTRGFSSYIQGYNSTSTVSNVNIVDLKMNDNYVTNASQGNFTINANTSNISFSKSLENNAYYKISSKKSGRFADVEASSLENGATVHQWSNNNQFNQEWQLVDAGNGYYKIINRNSGKVLDVEGNSKANGAKVIQWTDNGGHNQQWEILNIGDGYYKIKSRSSGKLLDVENGSTANGAKLIQYSDNGGDNQKWQLVKQ